MRGVEVTEETLALDVIDQVGPGGHFLGEDHTLKHFRQNWVPKLLDRSTRGEWEAGGQLTLKDRAQAKVREILEQYQPAPLDEVTAAELEAVIQRAEERVP
jgi:trimethylamine--corrinoid protein Co-methyltransferase